MLVSLLGSTALVRRPCTHGDAAAWHRGLCSKIGLLPFAFAEALLPGEQIEIHLAEPHQLALFDTATERDRGCVGMLLEDGGAACAIAPLLELRESRRRDDAGGLWCRFCCVSAVRLQSVAMSPSGAAAAHLQANTCALRESLDSVDFDSADEEEAYLAIGVREEFEEVAVRRRAIQTLKTRAGRTLPDAPPAADDFALFGHRLEPEVGPFCSVEELVALRLEALCARGPDAAPDADLGRLHSLWGSPDEESARRRLLSFAVCGVLGERARLHALAIEDTEARLAFALSGLTNLKASLGAELALRKAAG